MDSGARVVLVTEDDLARIRLSLVSQARLFDDPAAYVAGVEDALAQVLELRRSAADRPPEPERARML